MRGAGPRAAAGSDHTRAADAPGPMVGAIVERVRRNRSYCRPRVNQDKALAGSISRRGWHGKYPEVPPMGARLAEGTFRKAYRLTSPLDGLNITESVEGGRWGIASWTPKQFAVRYGTL